MDGRPRIVCDLAHCLGCRRCQLACAAAHPEPQAAAPDGLRAAADDLLAVVRALRSGAAPPRSRVVVRPFAAGGLPVRCQQCEEPPCVDACIAAARRRDVATGKLAEDPERCVGCFLCLMVCRYGASVVSADGQRVVRCDLCQGRAAGPACVEACPCGALRLEEGAGGQPTADAAAAGEGRGCAA